MKRILDFDQDLSVSSNTSSGSLADLTDYLGEGLLLHCSFLLVPTISLLGRRGVAFDIFIEDSQDSELAGFHNN
jgi:hypothetical protein